MSVLASARKARLAALLAGTLLLSLEPAFGAGYDTLAGQLSDKVQELGLSRIAVADFSAEDAPFTTDSLQAQAGLLDALHAQAGTDTMSASAADNIRGWGSPWAEVLVKGRTFRNGLLVVRAIDQRTGRTIAVFQLPLGKTEAAPGPGFRDAPADIKPGDCAGLAGPLLQAGRDGLELSARYWAGLARTPGAFYPALGGGRPGSELTDPPLRQKFEALFGAYYEQPAPVTLTDGERAKAEDLIARAGAYRKACGPAKK